MLVSLILLVVLMMLWLSRDRAKLRTTSQLTTRTAVDTLLDDQAAGRADADTQVRIPTGVFLQSMKFVSANDVRFTGYVWQRFDGDVRDQILSDGRVDVVGPDGQVTKVLSGLIFPQQVDTSFSMERRFVHYNEPRAGSAPSTSLPPPSVVATTTTGPATPAPPVTEPPATDTLPPMLFRSSLARLATTEGTTVVGWYFEAPVRQMEETRAQAAGRGPDQNPFERKSFDYSDYPFDDKVIRLRVWPADFENNVVLVPDFDAYPCQAQPTTPCTKDDDIFGIDNGITLGNFLPKNTWFDYHREDYYSSNLGLDHFQQTDYPELQFNILIRRNIGNAFVSSFVPLAVIAGLAFAVLLTITTDERRSRRFRFSPLQVVTATATLFFALLLAHLQLRNQFENVVYFDWFYFLTYLVLLGVAVNAVLVAAPNASQRLFLRYGDNLIPQLLFWPTVLGAAVLLTVVIL